MDLIYADESKRDIGVLLSYQFDLAYGEDENNFQLTINKNSHCCEAGYFVYIEGTEYGGVIDSIRAVTQIDELVYIGRTWHGILASKVLEPDTGQDYLILSGECNAVIGELVERMGIEEMFTYSKKNSGVSLDNYKMNRYIDAYTGITKMLKSVGLKLSITFVNGYVELSAIPIIDYSSNEEFDSTQIDMTIEKNYKPVNHMICLGKGELKDRLVIHLYADGLGNISRNQTFAGIDERAVVYDNSTTESLEELEKGGIEQLQEYLSEGKLDIELDATQTYGIGDVVAAREVVTDMLVRAAIIKKIVTIKNEMINIQYKVG